MAFLEEIRTELINRGIGITFPGSESAYAIGIGEWTDSPDRQITLFELAGREGLRVLDRPGEKYVRQVLEVVVRGAAQDYAEPRSKAQEIWSFMNGQITNRELSGTHYLQLSALLSPILLRRDEKDRVYFQISGEAFKLPS